MTREGARQLAGEPGVLSLLPEVIWPAGKESLGVHRRIREARLLVSLDLLEQRLSAGGKFEGVNAVLRVHRHDDPVGLPNDARQFRLGVGLLPAEALRPHRIHRLGRELRFNVLPTE